MAETACPEPVSLAGKDIHLSFGKNAVLRGVDIDVARGCHGGGDRTVRLG
jgi:polar amino acid transport system ATP-binding protein